MSAHNSQRFVRTDFGVKRIRAIRETDFHNRSLMAHADAADAFDGDINGEIFHSLAQRVKQEPSPTRISP